MPDLPTFANGGIALLALLVLVLVAVVAPHPLPWRCNACAERFASAALLDAHEARHASECARRNTWPYYKRPADCAPMPSLLSRGRHA